MAAETQRHEKNLERTRKIYELHGRHKKRRNVRASAVA
jgi:hypothetical protein